MTTIVRTRIMPPADLDARIHRYKTLVCDLVGDATFLTHNPHLTLNLNAFTDPEQAATRITRVCARHPAIRIHTTRLTYLMPGADDAPYALVLGVERTLPLQHLQEELALSLADIRTGEAFRDLLRADGVELLPRERDTSVQYGTPWVGEAWTPHFTIAQLTHAQQQHIPDALLTETHPYTFVAKYATIMWDDERRLAPLGRS